MKKSLTGVHVSAGQVPVRTGARLGKKGDRLSAKNP